MVIHSADNCIPQLYKKRILLSGKSPKTDWNTKLLTLTGDNWEIWAIQIFPDAPPEFDSEIERRHWAQQHIISATELKEQLEMSYGNPNDPRIDKNPRVSRVRWLPKLQLARDASKRKKKYLRLRYAKPCLAAAGECKMCPIYIHLSTLNYLN